jgi:hypothetical protein
MMILSAAGSLTSLPTLAFSLYTLPHGSFHRGAIPRRPAISAVRKVINENLPDGYEEGMQFGMIGWYVPLSMYPAGYGENPKVPLFPDPRRRLP